MNCEQVRESLESYICKELDGPLARRIDDHLRRCDACTDEYLEMRRLIGRIKGLKEMILLDAASPVEAFWLAHRKKKLRSARLKTLVVGLTMALSIASSSLLAFPALAKRVPALPIGENIESLEKENKKIDAEKKKVAEENQKIEREVERLKGEITKVKGTPIRIEGDGNLPETENREAQRVVMDFVRAQYAGDVETMNSLSTPALAAKISERPGDYLREEFGEVTFATITNIIKKESDLLIFIKINDSKKYIDTEYQEDFVLKKIDASYRIDDMGTEVELPADLKIEEF
ncbi:MAG: hypothetical protein ACYC1U_10950 [Candidatus Aquicultorales bacterium]